MAGPAREFWQQRFVPNETPWDRGAANPQLATWLASAELEFQWQACPSRGSI
jgi:hypothetical protein